MEALIARARAADGGADADRARTRFEERTGPFAHGDSWHEERIELFFAWYLCEWRSPDGSRPSARLLEEGIEDDTERELARACLTAHRSLFRVVEAAADRVTLADELGAGRYRVFAEGAPSRPMDRFDAHLVAIRDDLWVLPGIVFHPPEAHAPLDGILTSLRARADFEDTAARGLGRQDVLDGLLRMRMRLDRFTSIRAKHVYRLEALGDMDIMSAGWAKRAV